MSNPLADRLKKIAADQAREEKAVTDVRSYQERGNTFISENVRPEYDKLLAQLQRSIDEINPELGDLPPFRFNPGMVTIQQGNCIASLYFDKPILNQPQNQLLISFGPHPNNMYFDAPPASIRYRLQGGATDALDTIVWLGDLGEMTTSQLGDFILEQLTNYYLEHKPGA